MGVIDYPYPNPGAGLANLVDEYSPHPRPLLHGSTLITRPWQKHSGFPNKGPIMRTFDVFTSLNKVLKYKECGGDLRRHEVFMTTL